MLSRLLPDLRLNCDLYWILISNARGRDRNAVKLTNFLIVSLKNVIYWSYRSLNFSDPLLVWTHRLKSKIVIEIHYYRLNSSHDFFFNKWYINDSLFTVVNNRITWLI